MFLPLLLLISVTLNSVSGFSCGHLYYRTLHLSPDESTLYVGAMDAMYRLDAANITGEPADACLRNSLTLKATNVANCVSKGKSEEFDCRNHVRVIQTIADGQKLYVCGTNAHDPRDHVIYANLTKLARHEFYPGIGDGIAKCPFDPEDNSTAIWVQDGNPGGHPAIYSGTNAEFTKADTVIFRGDIFDEKTGRREYTFKRTIKYDSHMLDKPDFVGSYEVGDYVYFFFRETAVEYMNCGKTIYSRVARVCKKDVGGKNILSQNWATYLKARLNCSIPGEFPFFFNEIQHVYKARNDDSTFHAVFSTSQNGLKGSAICSFKLDDIQATFNGKYKEQATSTSVWLPVPSASVPTPRPGQCVDDTRTLSDTVLNFIRKHPLMDTDVPHDAQGPVFYERDVFFTKIVVDTVASKDDIFEVYFAGTDEGKVYKVSRWRDEKGNYQSKLLDVFDATSPDPVRAMELSKKNRAIYVSSDRNVEQLSTQMCSLRYENCVACVRDPYCGWDRESGVCRPRQSPNSYYHLLSDPAGKSHSLCDASAPREKVEVNFGQSVHLQCKLNSRQNYEDQSEVSWFHFTSQGKRKRVHFDNEKYVQTQDKGLVILGAVERDAGRYQCRIKSGDSVIVDYDLTVDAHRCSSPEKTADYQKVYSQWCQQFQKYRDALKSWEEKQNKCAAFAGADIMTGNNVYNPLV